MLWGYPVEVWDLWGVRLLFWGALFGVGGLVVSAFSAYVLYRVAEVSQQALIVESKAGAERIAELNNDTARLTGDNLALQTVLLPRHIGLVGLNGPPPAMEWFAGLETFTGTQVEIQSVLDPEAENLAKEIAIILTMKGLHPFSVNESRTRMAPTQISNGINIWYPTGKPWTAAEPNQPWFAWNRLAEALATALTRAGLAVGNRRVSVAGFSGEPPITGLFPQMLAPPLTGVLIQVGARPVAETVQWIKQGRPNELGETSAPAKTGSPK